MPQNVTIEKREPNRASVLTKAVLKVAERLHLTARSLAHIIGVSEATVSRMKSGSYVLEQGSKSFELAVILVRIFRSLDAITGGDEAVACSWLRNHNTFLGETPLNKLQTITGLFDVSSYLDARRALV